MVEVRIIVAGTRTFGDYDLTEEKLKEKLWKYQIKRSTIRIISGNAKGPDKHGIKFSEKYGLELTVMPADWTKNGYAAGAIRNEEMARFAKKDGSRAILFAIWDGESHGTLNMIQTAQRYEMDVWIYNYKSETWY